MKWWLLFLFDLAVIVTGIRACYLTYAASKGVQDRAWVASEAAGWMAVACVVAFAAFVAAAVPG